MSQKTKPFAPFTVEHPSMEVVGGVGCILTKKGQQVQIHVIRAASEFPEANAAAVIHCAEILAGIPKLMHRINLAWMVLRGLKAFPSHGGEEVAL